MVELTKAEKHIRNLKNWDAYAISCQNEYDWLLKQKPLKAMKTLEKMKWLRDIFITRKEEQYFEVDSSIKVAFDEAISELEALQQPKRCDGCGYGKTTINSVICGKNGTYKEADDYCKYYNPKEQ